MVGCVGVGMIFTARIQSFTPSADSVVVSFAACQVTDGAAGVSSEVWIASSTFSDQPSVINAAIADAIMVRLQELGYQPVSVVLFGGA
jgi:hypothetical protein